MLSFDEVTNPILYNSLTRKLAPNNLELIQISSHYFSFFQRHFQRDRLTSWDLSIYVCKWEHDSPYCLYLFIYFTHYSLNSPPWKVLKNKSCACYLISWHQNVLNNLGGERDCFVLCFLSLCWILVQRSIKSSLSCSIYWAQVSLQGKWTQNTSKVPTHSWGWEQWEDLHGLPTDPKSTHLTNQLTLHNLWTKFESELATEKAELLGSDGTFPKIHPIW